MAKVMEQGPVLVLTFMVQQIMILRDAVGNVIEGGEVSYSRFLSVSLHDGVVKVEGSWQTFLARVA